jgi:hypothetical protein
MSSSVGFYVKYSGDPPGLAQRVAELLLAKGYLAYGRSSYLVPFASRPFIGVDGLGQLGVDRTDLGRYGDTESAAGTAFAPYEFELSLEYRGVDRSQTQFRLADAVFHRLTQLGLPLAYGGDGNGQIYGDYLPERGTRMMPEGTPEDDGGRVHWFEPRLHHRPEQPWSGSGTVAPPNGPGAPAVVYETGDVLHMVAAVQHNGEWLWSIPAASVVASAGPREIGLVLGYARRPGPVAIPVPLAGVLDNFTAVVRLSTEEFLSRAASVELHVDGDSLIAQAHTPARPGEISGPVVAELTRRVPVDAAPDQVGQLLLDLFAAVKVHS